MRVLMLLGFFVSLASAQNVQTFYATDLAIVPGLIEVSPGFGTTIELYDQVNLTLSGDNAELFLVEDLGDQLNIKTATSNATIGAKIMVRGRRLLFEITANADDPKIRTYVVKESRGRAYAPTTAPQSFGGEAERMGVSEPAQQPPPTAEQPQDASGQAFTLRPAGFDAQGYLTVFFTYTNGDERAALDPSRLRATQEERELTLEVVKSPLGNLMAPLESQNGFITVKGAAPGSVTLAWEVVELTEQGGVTQVHEEFVDAE